MGIEFDNENFSNNSLSRKNVERGDNSSTISKWFIDKGIIKDEKTADIFSMLIAGIFVLGAVFSIWFFMSEESTNQNIELTPEQRARLPRELQNTPDSFLPRILESNPRYKYIINE